MVHPRRLSAFATLALALTACRLDTRGGSSGDGSSAEVPDAAHAPDVAARDVADVIDASDARDLADVIDASDARDLVDVTDVTDAADAPMCLPAMGTFDCGTEEIARTICDVNLSRGRPCLVCVQERGSDGLPFAWAAVEATESCGCPPERMGPRFTCGASSCRTGVEVCVHPPGPGTCPTPDAGVCPPGCPGCPPLSPATTCRRAQDASCLPFDCACFARAFCDGRSGVCSGDAFTGLSVRCLGV